MVFGQINVHDRVDFTKNLAIMLKSGITINEALAQLKAQTRSKHFRNVIASIHDSIISGSSLSTSFKQSGDVFGNVFIGLVQAGERSGTLESSFNFLSDWMEKSLELQKEVRGATLYPKLVFAVSVLLGTGLIVFIFPQLVPMFSKLQVELPLVTQLLLSFSVFVSKYWILLVIVLIGLFVGTYFLIQITFVKRILHTLYLKVPGLRRLIIEYQLTLMSHLFYVSLKSGLTLAETLDIIYESLTNHTYKDSIDGIRKNVIKGTTLSSNLSKQPELYPANFIGIVAVGEKSGTLSEVFEYLATYYAKEVSIKVKKLPTLLEPVLLFFIAIVVGVIALSIILPIYQLTGNIQR